MSPHHVAGQPGWLAPAHFKDLRVQMLGVGGSGMAGLAAVLLHHGATVFGTDRTLGAVTDKLALGGAKITAECDAPPLPEPLDLVVASAAVPSHHPLLAAARVRGVRTMKYAEMLGAIFDAHDAIAVSGTHGKSTTTAWLTYVLRHAGLDPSFVVGAVCPQLGGGSGVGGGRHFVAEACEYDRSFHHLHPTSAAILNIEEDHLDCYKDLAEIQASFAQFAGGIREGGLLVLNGSDVGSSALPIPRHVRTTTFAASGEAEWTAGDPRLRDGRYEITLCRHGAALGRVHLGLAGRHNVANALAVAALAVEAGAEVGALLEALETFTGVGRRLETRGVVAGITVVDDYAHHPTEIRATLAAARERFTPHRLWCIFQPHQHSRTRFLLDDFAGSFGDADKVVVPRIYFVRDSERDRQAVSASDLVERILARGGDATHIAEFDDIIAHVASEVRAGDLIMTMGAGDVWKVADELVQRIRAHLPG